tara:strand:+ start:854 stop:1255 length:402 start_codon:yes stop_codon:yes gene_type:complete
MKTRIILTFFSCFFISVLSSQEKLKDTLFFKFDKKYINTYEQIPHHFYLDDSSGSSDGSFFFEELGIIDNVKPKEILCLKKAVRSSKFYNKQKKRKLDDNGLFEYFDNYIIFLVKKNKNTNIYIRVRANWEIE